MDISKNWITYWSKRKASFIQECNFERNKLLWDIAHPVAAQERVLKDIIRMCKNSLYWKERNYSKITDMTTFRDILPIMKYEDFEPLLDRETLAKGGILACSPVLRWLRTSGTTGVPKKIPYSLHWMLNYRVSAMKVVWANYYTYYPEVLDNPYATLDTQTVLENTTDYLQGVPYQLVSNRHPRLSIFDWNPPWFEAPWFNSDVPANFDERMYYRIRFLIGKQLYFINAINPSTLLAFHEHIAINREKLIQEIASGTINNQPFEEANILESQRLEKILSKEDFSLVDIWPNLKLYSCWFSASAGLYQNFLEKIFGNRHRLPFMSCGTEGVVTLPIDDSIYSQPLAINQAFYEFVEENIDLEAKIKNKEKIQTLLFNKIKAGKNYHLIMSQANGLFRLWTGDVYRVDRIADNDIPWIHFVHRVGIFHSFTGEKLTELDITSTLESCLSRLGKNLGLYLCGPKSGKIPGYVIVIETSNANENFSKKASEIMDQELMKINIEYQSKRSSNRLKSIKVITVQEGIILRYFEGKRATKNSNQYKYNPFQKNVDFLDELNLVKSKY